MKTKNVTLQRIAGFGFLALLMGGMTAQVLRPVAAEESNPISQNTAAPELVGTTWINAPGVRPKLSAQKGRVTLLHFWTHGCINCKRNLPAYNQLYKKYKGQGVTFLSVHTPETRGEMALSGVRQSVRHFGIAYPVLIDNKGTNWDRWHQEFWPTVYLIDKQGRVRYRWEGELEIDHQDGTHKLAALIEKLQKEK